MVLFISLIIHQSEQLISNLSLINLSNYGLNYLHFDKARHES